MTLALFIAAIIVWLGRHEFQLRRINRTHRVDDFARRIG